EFDALLDAFDDAWQTGPPPNIDDYLRPDAAYHADLLRELVQMDLERRLRTPGLEARVEDYLSRYPELQGDRPLLFALVRVEQKWRWPGGGGVRREEYSRRFPRYRDELGPHLVASPAQPETQPYPPAPSPRTGPDALPRIPGYEVLEPLGRGNMGVVYRARDLRLGRAVALKMLLHGALSSPELLARFEAEARAVAALSHPNIVQVFELGTHDGLPFLALEFVAGGSLAGRMTAGPLPAAEAAAL